MGFYFDFSDIFPLGPVQCLACHKSFPNDGRSWDKDYLKSQGFFMIGSPSE